MDAAIVERFGILGIMLVGIWYTGRWMAAKVVEPLVNSHTGLVDQLKISDSQQIETLSKLAVTLDRVAETQQEICQILEPMRNRKENQ